MLSAMDSVSTDHLLHSEIQFEIVEDSAGFRALEDAWQSLCARAPDHEYFYRFPWMWRVWRHVASARGRRLCIIVGRSGGRVVLIWPLMRDGRQIRFLASDKVEYRDLIVEHGPHADDWMAAAWRIATSLKHVDLLLFQDIRMGSHIDRLLKSGHKSGWKHEQRSHVIRLDRFKGWDDYAATLSKSMMKNQRKQWRRIAADGEPAQCVILTSREQVRETLDWLLHHKLAWLQASGIDDTGFGSTEYLAFIHDAVQEAFDSGHLLFAKLLVGDRTAAAGMGYKHGSDFIFHMFTYDAAWQSYSPGRLLQEHIIKWCFDNGVASFDFMPGEEGHKGPWSNDAFCITDYLIPMSVRGAAIVRWHASGLSARIERSWLRTAFHHLPGIVRRRLNATLLEHREYSGRVERL